MFVTQSTRRIGSRNKYFFYNLGEDILNILAKNSLIILLFSMHTQTLLKIIAPVLIILLVPAALYADPAPENGNLFISSTPLNAEILIDGRPVIQKTPALIRDLAAGEHRISLRKDDYAPIDTSVTIIPGETVLSTSDLQNDSLILSLPDADAVYLRTDSEKELPGVFRLPAGEFRIDINENNSYYIEPLYPNEALLYTSGILFAASAVMTNAAAINEISSRGEIDFPHSLWLTVSETTMLISAVCSIALMTDRSRFFRDYRIYSADPGDFESAADEIYGRAQRALSLGSLEEALSGFSRLISEYGDSSRFPEALYRIAKIHIISGDTNLAVSELKIIIENYPDPDIYDRTCQTLALLYYNRGELEESRRYAEKMVFFDPLFSSTPGDIERLGIARVIENWARNPQGQAE